MERRASPKPLGISGYNPNNHSPNRAGINKPSPVNNRQQQIQKPSVSGQAPAGKPGNQMSNAAYSPPPDLFPKHKNLDYKKVLASGQPFADPYFEPLETSLVNLEGSKLGENSIAQWLHNIEFRRVYELMGAQDGVSLFGPNSLTPDNILQGSLGNCYFVSALCTICSESPNRLKQIFLNSTVNMTGLYGVRFCINGEFQNVFVDDFIPVDRTTGLPVFSRTKDGTLWLSILEKAWAKIHGNYERTANGNIGDAYLILTGAPIKVINIEIEEQSFRMGAALGGNNEESKGNFKNVGDYVFDEMRKAVAQNLKVSCATGKKNVNPQNYYNVGLNYFHAYSLLGVYDIGPQLLSQSRVPAQRARLIKLRNPWGSQNWTGAWGVSSENWMLKKGDYNYALMAEVGYQMNEDGVFLVSVEDFIRFFSNITISKQKDNYHFQSHRCHISQNSRFKLLSIYNNGASNRVSFYVYQNFHKLLSQDQNYDYAFTKMMLVRGQLQGNGRFNPGEIEYLFGTRGNQIVTEQEQVLQKGHYTLYVELDTNKAGLDFSVCAYSQQELQVQKVEGQLNMIQIIDSYLSACASRKMEKHYYGARPENDVFRSLGFKDSGCDYGFIYYQNDSNQGQKPATLVETVKFTSMQNVKIHNVVLSARKDCELTVKPGERKIIIIVRAGENPSFACQFMSKVQQQNSPPKIVNQKPGAVQMQMVFNAEMNKKGIASLYDDL